jgi:hypothetical protein
VASWWFLLNGWGWLWGLTVGWIPALMLALLVGWLSKWLWPVWAAIIFFGALFIGTYLSHPDPNAPISVPPVPEKHKPIHFTWRSYSIFAGGAMALWLLASYLEQYEIDFWEFDGQNLSFHPSVTKKTKQKS